MRVYHLSITTMLNPHFPSHSTEKVSLKVRFAFPISSPDSPPIPSPSREKVRMRARYVGLKIDAFRF